MRAYDDVKGRRIRRAVWKSQLNGAAIKVAFLDFCAANGHAEALAEEFGAKARDMERLRAALIERTQEWTRRSHGTR